MSINQGKVESDRPLPGHRWEDVRKLMKALQLKGASRVVWELFSHSPSIFTVGDKMLATLFLNLLEVVVEERDER